MHGRVDFISKMSMVPFRPKNPNTTKPNRFFKKKKKNKAKPNEEMTDGEHRHLKSEQTGKNDP